MERSESEVRSSMTKYAFLEKSIDDEMQKEAALSWRPWRWFRDNTETGNEYNWGDLWNAVPEGSAIAGNQVMHSFADAGADIGRAGNWIVNRANNNIGPAQVASWFGDDWRLPEAEWNQAINEMQKANNEYYDSGDIGRSAAQLREDDPVFRNAAKAWELGSGALAMAPVGGAVSKGAKALGGSLVGRSLAANTALGRAATSVGGSALGRSLSAAGQSMGMAPMTTGEFIGGLAGAATTASPMLIGTPEGNLAANGMGHRMGWQTPEEYNAEIKSVLPLINPAGERNAVPDRIVSDWRGNPYYSTDEYGNQYRQRLDGEYVVPGMDGYEDADPVPMQFGRPTTDNDARRFALLARDMPEYYQTKQLGNPVRASVVGDALAREKPWFRSGGQLWNEEDQSYYPFVYPEMAKDENGRYVQAPWRSRIVHDLPFGENANVEIPLPFGRHFTLDANQALNGAMSLGQYNPYSMLTDAAGFAQEGRNTEAARELAGAALTPVFDKAVPYLSKFVPHPILGTARDWRTWWRPPAEVLRGAGYLAAGATPYIVADVNGEDYGRVTPNPADVEGIKGVVRGQPDLVSGVNTMSGFPKDVYEAIARGEAANGLADEGRAPAVFSHAITK